MAVVLSPQTTNPVRMTHSTLRKNIRRTKGKMSADTQPGPRPASIQFILGYSRALRVVDAPPIGPIDLILN